VPGHIQKENQDKKATAKRGERSEPTIQEGVLTPLQGKDRKLYGNTTTMEAQP